MANNEKKGFLKNNPFFSVTHKEAEPVAPPQYAPPTQMYAPPPASTPMTNFPLTPPVPVAETTAEMEEEYLNHWMEFLEKHNIQGLDYWEFAQLLHKQFEKFGATLTEAQLYEMAFMSFETQGITKQRLIETANTYLKLAAEHKAEFDKYQNTDGAKALQDIVNENARLEKANAEAAAQIVNLQTQIQTIQQSVVSNTQTIQGNTSVIQAENDKLVNKQRKFEANYKIVTDKISGDVQKIQAYIK